MEKRFQVFVSSTYQDLQDERAQVMQALLELDSIPAGMEMFPAANEDQWTLIKRVIDDCDYYVVIVGNRYGSTDKEGVSYTEREYDYAVLTKKPVLAFLHQDADSLPASKSEMSEHGRKKLAAFRDKVRKRMCQFWNTPEELGGKVSRSLVKVIKTNPAEGWVRGRYAASPEMLAQVNSLRSQIDELTAQLAAARTSAPVGTEGLAQGLELVVLSYSYRASYEEYSVSVSFSWDQLFATISPLMFHEADESSLRLAIQDLIEEECANSLSAEHAGEHISAIRLSASDFNLIKVQFRALGMIRISDRKHAASDTNTYWTLTPYGEEYATRLTAVRGSSVKISEVA